MIGGTSQDFPDLSTTKQISFKNEPFKGFGQVENAPFKFPQRKSTLDFWAKGSTVTNNQNDFIGKIQHLRKYLRLAARTIARDANPYFPDFV